MFVTASRRTLFAALIAACLLAGVLPGAASAQAAEPVCREVRYFFFWTRVVCETPPPPPPTTTTTMWAPPTTPPDTVAPPVEAPPTPTLPPPPAPAPTPPPPAGPTTPPPAYPGPGLVNGDTIAHDPTVVKRPDGTYLVATTGAGITLKTSTDRTTFRDIGAAFPSGATWTTRYTGGSRDLWAPHLSFVNGTYYLYYSASSFGSTRSAIFLATSTTGESGSWSHRGLVVETSSSSNYNAIDPDLFIDDQGNWWMTFGSFWSGIKQIRLDPATGLRADSGMTSLAARSGGSQAVEAPTLFKRGDSYYLFVSWDRCCQGADSTYRIMVGRSSSPNGPFVDRNGTPMTSGGGTQILASHGNINGPGHQDVFTDADADVLTYHYYPDDGSHRLGINLLGWTADGWPFVY